MKHKQEKTWECLEEGFIEVIDETEEEEKAMIDELEDLLLSQDWEDEDWDETTTIYAKRG